MPTEPGDTGFLSDASYLIRQIFEYWDRIRGSRAMPSRRDFDPVEVPAHLPGLLLVDVEGVDKAGVGIYRYRVVGTAEVANRGHDPTGRLVVEGHLGPSLEAILNSYEAVRRRRTFLYEPLHVVTKDNRTIDEYSILLPFSEDGRTVSQILVFSERRVVRQRPSRR